jgi:hypothetical protein
VTLSRRVVRCNWRQARKTVAINHLQPSSDARQCFRLSWKRFGERRTRGATRPTTVRPIAQHKDVE